MKENEAQSKRFNNKYNSTKSKHNMHIILVNI